MSDTPQDVLLNPLTGLPRESTTTVIKAEPAINPLTGNTRQRKAPPKTKSYLGTVGGANYDVTKAMSFKDYESFLDYGVDVRRGIDHVEARAQNQSTFEKVSRGLTKASITAVGALGENTVGLMYGLGSLATGGNFYDNDFGRGIDSMNEWAAETMPNYYTRAEENADVFSTTNLVSANFWADKVANGLGYVVGSIATDAVLAYATGGTSLTLTAARYAAKFGKAATVLSAAQKAKALKNVYNVSKAAQKGKKIGTTLVDGSSTLTNLASKGGWKSAYARAENGLVSAIGESNVEARQAKNQTREALIEKWTSQPENEGKTVDDIPEETLAEIEAAATSAGNTVFSINMPIVGGTNAITIGRMLGPGYRKSVQRMANKESKGSLFNIRKAKRNIDSDTPYVEAGLDRNWVGRAAYRVNKVAGDKLKSSASEAFQEGSQVFASEFSEEYYTDKYLNGPNNADLVGAMEHGFRRTFGTKEGIESMLIGAIVGGGTMSITSAARRIRGKDTARQIKQKNTQEALDLLNSGVLTKPIEKIIEANKASGLTERLNVLAARAADTSLPIQLRRKAHKEFKDTQYQLYAQQANSLINQGRMDLVMEQLDDAKDLTDEEFKKAFGYEQEQPLPEGGKAAIVNKLKDRLKKHKKTRDRIDEIAPALQPTTGLPRSLMSEEAIEKENLELEANNFYRTSLFNRASQIDGHTERMGNMYNELQALSDNSINSDSMGTYEYDLAGRQLYEDIDTVAMDPNDVSSVMDGELVEELNRVEESITDPLGKIQFKALKEDYIHLAAERQAIINSFEALTGKDGPVTAEFMQLKQQAMEEVAAEEKLQKETDAIIESAEVPDDFSTFPSNATEAQKNKAKAKAEELGKQIFDIATEQYSGKTLEELEQIDRDALGEEENGAQKVAALDVALIEAGESEDKVFRGKIEPNNEDHKAKLEEDAEENANLDNNPPPGPDGQEADVTDPAPTPGTTTPKKLSIGIVDNRDYETAVIKGTTRIILDENGKPTKVTEKVPSKNGIPIPIDFKAVQNIDPNGAPVTFEFDSELDFNKELEKDENLNWRTATILVKQGDNVIGFLKSFGNNKSFEREQIFNKLKDGEVVQAIAKPTGKASTANVRDKNGNKVFTTLTDLVETPVLGFVEMPGKQMKEVVAAEGFSQEDTDIARALSGTTTTNFTQGQVVVGVRKPDGTIIPIGLSTRDLKDLPNGVTRAMELATSNQMGLFKELVGTNKLDSVDEILNQETYLNVNANESLVFYSPSNKSFVKMYPEQLIKLKDGSADAKVQLVNATVEGFEDIAKTPGTTSENILEELKTVIEGKKLQVDNAKANQADTTFINPMTGDEQNYREYLYNKENPVVRIDMHPDVGIFYNVGLGFSDLNIGGETKEGLLSGETTPVVEESQVTADTKEDVIKGTKRGPRKNKRSRVRKTGTKTQPTQQSKPSSQLDLFEDEGNQC